MLDLDKLILTGEQMIDGDHRKIYATLNEIEDELRGEADRSAVVRLLTALEDYSVTHFQREERVMACLKCPLRGVNCDAHRQFLSRLDQWFVTLSDAAATPEEVARIHAECCRWISTHIERVDSTLRQSMGAA